LLGVPLLLVVIVAGGFQVSHVHADSQPGLYNEDCPFAEAAQRTSGAALANALEVIQPLLASGASIQSGGAVLPSFSPLVNSSRAPPLN